MKIRTVYLKVGNMGEAVSFWQQVLERAPHRQSEKWTEFAVGEVRLGLLLNDFGDPFDGFRVRENRATHLSRPGESERGDGRRRRSRR